MDALVERPSTTSDNWAESDEADLKELFLSLTSAKDDTFIEISSYGPASGKTALITLIVVLAILPSDYHGVDLFGRDGTVVLFDNDDRFDTKRVFTLIKAYVKQRWLDTAKKQEEQVQEGNEMDVETKTTKPSFDLVEEAIDTLARKCLQHVHIFRPQSWSSFITCIDDLPTYLLNDHPSHKSAQKVLRSIIVDGMSAFHWQRRAEEESRKTDASNMHSKPAYTIEDPNQGGLINRLRSLGRRFECPIIVTTLQQAPSSRNSKHHGNIAGANVLITVERVHVRSFPNCISFAEARELHHMREQEVERHEFRVSSRSKSFVFVMKDGDMVITTDIEE